MNYFLKNFKLWTKKNIKKSMTLEPSYFYWCNTLTEYAIRLFTWHGLPKNLPQHEIEISLLTHGFASIVLTEKTKNKWISPFNISREGITDYYDIFTHINYATPLHFGKAKIGESAIIISNNSLKMPLLPKIQRYAALLAHAEVSMVSELVNDRNSVLYEAINGKQADKVNLYQTRLYNGEFDTLVNSGYATIKTTDLNKRSNGECEKIWIVRNKILQAFLEEIGIKKASEKKERMITDETNGNDEMLRLNLSDMLECRQKAASEFMELMKLLTPEIAGEVTVSCNIDYLSKNNSTGVDLPNA